ncbi:MAG: hypothetical protein OHK0015_43540 [Chloroflexi bacterium OHK40]
MATSDIAERYGSFRYLIELDGVTRGAFGSCTGLAEAHRQFEYFIGDDEVDLREVSDPGGEPQIVLGQGVAFDDTIPEWQFAAAHGHAERHDGAILELDGLGRVRARWHFRGAWPVRMEGDEAPGGGAEPRIQTLAIVCEGVQRG